MGKKKKLDKNKQNSANKYNVTNYPKSSSFFFDVTKIYPCIENLNDKLELRINNEELNKLNEVIMIMRNKLNLAKSNNNLIEIIPEFKTHFQEMKIIDRSDTPYAKKIKAIIEEERKQSNKAISLFKIQKRYKEMYNIDISLSTISRVLRRHLNLHFRRVKQKNPRLNKKNYKFMKIIFLKGLMRGIKENLNIIFIDETGCFMVNDNYKDWVHKNEELLKGAENNLKHKYNIIMGILLEKIIYYKIVESNVDSTIFKEFLEGLISKLNTEQKKNSLIIYDNATYHKTKDVIELCLKNNLKIITNIPYRSEYNGIEYCFGIFKNLYYKYIFKDKNEQLKKIEELLNSEKLKNNLISCYIQAFEKYSNSLNDLGTEENLNSLYSDLSEISNEEKSASFE
jgi:transposase